MKYLLLIACFMLLTGATWDSDRKGTGKTLYEKRWNTKWDSGKTTEVDQPDQGWHRDPSSFSVPDSWPDWTKRRFQKLSTGDVSLFKKELMWDRPPLDANTKWMDAMADKQKGAIEIRIPSFNHFTFVILDPPQGIVDQDFKGNAKVYGLDDTKRYWIRAFDSRGYLGTAVTAISDKYVRVYDESSLDPSFEGFYSRTQALHAFEDPNGAVWVASQDPMLSGVSYYFPNLTAYDQSGKKRWNYRPLMGYNAPDEWEAGILHNRSDGSVVYATGRVPYTKPGYFYDGLFNIYTGYTLSDPATGHIAKILFSGATSWQQDSAAGAYKIISNTGASGYVYAGNYWEVGDNNWYGVVGQVDLNGNSVTWGNGESLVQNEYLGIYYRSWSLTKNNEGHYIVAGQYPRSSANRAMGGSASSDGVCSANPIANAFDGNDGTFANYKNCCAAFDEINTHWIQYDFGAGNTYAIELIRDNVDFTVDQWFRAFQVSGSNNGSDWTILVDQSVHLFNTTWPDTYFTNKTKFRYYRIGFSVDCGSVHADCDGNSCASGGEMWWGEEWTAYSIEMYEFEPYASLTKIYGLSGVSEGNVLSSVSFPAGRQFYDVTTNRNQDRIAAVGYSSGNSVYVVTVDNNLNLIQARTLTIGTEGRSIQPTEDGGYIISGTLIESGTTKLMVAKLGENLEVEWTEYFSETGSHGAAGRYAIETRDNGFLAVGGSYPTASSSKVYMIKGDRFHRSCSHGDPCR